MYVRVSRLHANSNLGRWVCNKLNHSWALLSTRVAIHLVYLGIIACRPRIVLHSGHLCSVSLKARTQNGTQEIQIHMKNKMMNITIVKAPIVYVTVYNNEHEDTYVAVQLNKSWITRRTIRCECTDRGDMFLAIRTKCHLLLGTKISRLRLRCDYHRRYLQKESDKTVFTTQTNAYLRYLPHR
jgi:hypothetical protein